MGEFGSGNDQIQLHEASQLQREIQRLKVQDRSLDLYNDATQYALPGGIVSYLSGREHPTWIDVGCGNGRALLDAAKLKSDATYVGLDVIPDLMPEAQPMPAQGAESLPPGVYFSQQNLDGNTNLHLPAKADLVTGLLVGKYLKDPLPMILQMINKLDPTGKLILSDESDIKLFESGSNLPLYWYDALRKRLLQYGGDVQMYPGGNKDNHMGGQVDMLVVQRGNTPELSLPHKLVDVRGTPRGYSRREYQLL